MPHVLKMKDGKLLTPFGIRDLLDAVQDYAGEELRREIEEYIETNVQDFQLVLGRVQKVLPARFGTSAGCYESHGRLQG